MKILKKLIFVVLLTALILTACSPAEEEVTLVEDADGNLVEPVTLQVWDYGGFEYEWMVTTAIPAFNELYPHITIEHLGIPEADFPTKLDTAIAANETPDIALQYFSYTLWKAGHFIPLDEFMEQDGITVEEFFPIYQSMGMLEGKSYLMPVNTYVWAMLINQDLFDQAGLPELTHEDIITYEDWLEYARAINQPADSLEDRVFGSVNFHPVWNSMNNYMSEPFVLGADGRDCYNNSTTDDWINTWEILTTAHNEELVIEAAGGMIGDLSWFDLFQQGKLGMMPGTLGDATYLREQGVNVRLVGQPVVTPGWHGNAGAWFNGYGIMSNSEHPEEAWTFLKFMTTEVGLMNAEGDCGICGNPPSIVDQALTWGVEEPLTEASVYLLFQLEPPPFNPDLWTAVDPFYEGFRLMTDENWEVEAAVRQAAEECQETLDELWMIYDELDG